MSRSPPPPPVRELAIELPEGLAMPFTGEAWPDLRSFDVAPDGTFVVFEGVDADGVRLYRRPLDALRADPIPDTERAYYPFISPDGRWVAFFADGELRKAALDGSGTIVLGTAVASPFGATWLSGDEILISELGRLVRVSATEVGVRDELPDCGSPFRCWHPKLLPGAERVLVSGYRDAGVYSLTTGRWTPLVEGARIPMARFAAPGFLVYFQQPGELFASTFDPRTLEVGPPIPVLDGVRHTSDGEFALSRAGDIVFARGGSRFHGQLTWVAPSGGSEALPFEAQSYGVFRLDPTGRYVAATVYRSLGEIWLYDLVRGEVRKISDARDSEHPVWSPDGTEIAWGVGLVEAREIVARSVAGGAVRTVVSDAGFPYSWSSDGVMATVRGSEAGTNDIWFVDVASGVDEDFLASPSIDDTPMFSPDGTAIAYWSDVGGEWEVYVARYPPDGRAHRVSSGRGFFPLWSPDGRSVFYQGGEDGRAFYRVDVSGGLESPGVPVRILEGPYMFGPGHSFDVSPDGRRFLVVERSDRRESIASLAFVQGFAARVAEALGAGGPERDRPQ